MCREQPYGVVAVVVDPVFLGFWCRGRFFLASSSSSSNPAYPSFQVKGLIAKEREMRRASWWGLLFRGAFAH
jgi:hypothetical protein